MFSIIKRLRKKNKGKGKRTKDNNDNNNQNSNSSSSNSNNDTDSFKGMKVESAVNIAYTISSTVRNYLNAIDRSKVPDPTSIENPRLWPIIWNMLYNDPLLETLDKQQLIFRWNRKRRGGEPIIINNNNKVLENK